MLKSFAFNWLNLNRLHFNDVKSKEKLYKSLGLYIYLLLYLHRSKQQTNFKTNNMKKSNIYLSLIVAIALLIAFIFINELRINNNNEVIDGNGDLISFVSYKTLTAEN